MIQMLLHCPIRRIHMQPRHLILSHHNLLCNNLDNHLLRCLFNPIESSIFIEYVLFRSSVLGGWFWRLTQWIVRENVVIEPGISDDVLCSGQEVYQLLVVSFTMNESFLTSSTEDSGNELHAA